MRLDPESDLDSDPDWWWLDIPDVDLWTPSLFQIAERMQIVLESEIQTWVGWNEGKA